MGAESNCPGTAAYPSLDDTGAKPGLCLVKRAAVPIGIHDIVLSLAGLDGMVLGLIGANR